MNGRFERFAWAAVAVALAALSVPWFLWRDAAVAFGLPLWLWWHIGWMFVASAAFWLFTERAWGLGVHGGTR